MWIDVGRINVGPQRIVCLTEEPTEILYALREQRRIVGISGFTVRPPKARKEKPKVSAFTSAKIDEILKLEPDFVIGFSDIQAGIAQELIAAGVEVWISNHRSVRGIIEYIRRLGAIVGAEDFADRIIMLAAGNLQSIDLAAARYDRRPKVYFEEWDSPMISGIQWVSELIGIAGGDDIFPERATKSLARDRIVADPNEIIERAPDIIFGSWCGKRFRPEKVIAREGWSGIPAVQTGQVFEIKSPIILQPGLAALTDGISAIHRVIAAWQLRYG
ncbi:MAG: ABC transporter substrate-binding protein [Rudaea sp.]